MSTFNEKYDVVIGLEIHAQVNSKTKLFCSCNNDSFNKTPNTNICPICSGHPGTLPVLNKEVVEKGIRASLALNCEVPKFCKFDRKNYFYPDLPTGYQISQFDQPLAINGHLEIEDGDKKVKIGITRLHLENDAGKLSHSGRDTLCDYNRAGTPLMEIVSEPDIKTAAQASNYGKEVQKILRYVKASDCDMEKGMMRFDINVSIMPKGSKTFGTKVEVKNLNSFKSLEKALEYELKRQAKLKDDNQEIDQETRGWDDEKEITVSQRSKEQAHDYRYFPEPDLPPLILEEKFIKKIQESIPELPTHKKERLIKEYGLKEDDARILSDDHNLSEYYENACKQSLHKEKILPWITSHLMKFMNEELISINEVKIKAKQISNLVAIIENGQISHSVAKEKVFPEMYKTGEEPEIIIEKLGLKQLSDQNEIIKLCEKIIDENPKAILEIKEGKDKAFGFLIGQAMKESRGQANPKVLNQVMRDLINKKQ